MSFHKYVLFPDPNQLADMKQPFYAISNFPNVFYDISNFPNVFGAIDCTHKLVVMMMLGDSSTEKVYIPLKSKLPVMPKWR